MTVKSLKHSSLTDNVFYRSMLVGNEAFSLDEHVLDEVALSSSAANVTFSGLGAYTDYNHLQIRAVMQSDRAAFEWDYFAIRLNGDTGNNYAYHGLTGNSSTVSTYNSTSIPYIYSNVIVPAQQTAEPNTFGAAVLDILDFSSPNKNTTFRSFGGQIKTNYTGETPIVDFGSGLWNNTNAVTEIVIALGSGSNFNSGSRFTLIGLK